MKKCRHYNHLPANTFLELHDWCHDLLALDGINQITLPPEEYMRLRDICNLPLNLPVETSMAWVGVHNLPGHPKVEFRPKWEGKTLASATTIEIELPLYGIQTVEALVEYAKEISDRYTQAIVSESEFARLHHILMPEYTNEPPYQFLVYGVLFRRQHPIEPANTKGCTCPLDQLMRDGCKCGGFAREQARKGITVMGDRTVESKLDPDSDEAKALASKFWGDIG
jgi:hypothetical protein